MPTREHFFIESLSSLYTAVQSQRIFPDSKHFVDGLPTASPETIMALYEKDRQDPGFNLRAFVDRHFIFQQAPDPGYHSDNK
ncbi:MAG: hypothetical protein JST39_00075, partial [Bacteroidetes bacterium]|nr:hypothetical protein [Bacteroidota bacterium]